MIHHIYFIYFNSSNYTSVAELWQQS